MGLSDRMKQLGDRAKEAGDKAKEAGDKAKQLAAERQDQINQAVETAGLVANQKTRGRYRNQIFRATQKTEAYVEKLAQEEPARQPESATAPPHEPASAPAPPADPEPPHGDPLAGEANATRPHE